MGKLGYSTLTLTDLTETLPISLVLETNQEKNIQLKDGDFYTPNFNPNTGGEELIITPSLFLGSIEKDIPVDYAGSSYIYYEIGEMEEDGTEKKYYFYEGNESDEVYVDNKGCLHYKKNLRENLTIEAYVVGFKNKIDQDYITSELVRAQNPITILLLEQGKGIYTLVISSEDGREHFEENNKNNITLIATLYKGAEPITNEVTYLWDIVTDNDNDSNNDFKEEGNTITIQRADVDNIQVYQCIATFNGLEFSSQKIIRDFTDGYTNQLIADSSLILTPNNTTVTLTNQVWYQTGIINGDNITAQEEERFTYEWILLKSDNETEIVLSEEKGKKLEIKLNDSNSNYPKENFSILGKAIIDNKTVTINYADIKYQPVAYSVNVSPKTIFVPATKDGDYRGTEDTFIQTIKFQLLDENKSPLLYNSLDSTAPDLQQKDGDLSDFAEQIEQEAGLWSFEISFKLDTTENNNLWDTGTNSKTYEFTYVYLGNTFTEEFEVVKNYAGADGKQGFSGYTIDLSNEFHAFAGGEGQADADQDTSCKILAHYGDQERDIEKITIGSTGGTIIYQKGVSIGEKIYTIPNSKGYLFISAAVGSNNNEVKVNIRTNKSTVDLEKDRFLTGIEPINFYITIAGQSSDLTFLKTFTYTINYNGKSYRLIPSHDYIKYSEAEGIYEPSEITVSATIRQESGEAAPYSNAKIIYSFDNETWQYLGANGSIAGYKNLEKIYIRLYSSQAELSDSTLITSAILNNSAKYLLDTETILILTSMEGYKFGGNNLLKWTKELFLEDGKWTKSNISSLTIKKDGDFSVLNYNETSGASWKYFRSPKNILEKEYIGKEFCFSCLIYSDNWSTLSGTFNLGLSAFKDFDNNARDAYKNVGILNKDGPAKDIKYDGEWENGKWIKIWTVFSFSDLNGTDVGETPDPSFPNDIYKYYSFDLFLSSNGLIKIKKPKLELGNVPTEWSASPYDVTYEDIIGKNLIQSNTLSYVIDNISENKTYEKLIAELQPNTTYTLSWRKVSSLNSDTLGCLLSQSDENVENNSINNISLPDINIKKTTQLTFSTDNDNLTFYFIFENNSGEKITFESIKLEKGNVSSSYLLSEEEIDKMVSDAKQYTDNSINKLWIPSLTPETITTTDENNQTLSYNSYYIVDSEGNKIYLSSWQDLDDYVKTLGGRISQTNSSLTSTQTALTVIEGELKEVKGRIELNNDNADDPYILIGSSIEGSNLSLQLHKNELGFYENETKVAYFSSQKLYITQADVTTTLRIGTPAKDGGKGFLVFTTTKEEGVTLTWSNN